MPERKHKMTREYLLIRKESVECPVCLHFEVDSFCVFPCGHNVCCNCTTMIADQLKVKVTWILGKFYECPVCRQRVSPKDCERPPRNYAIQKLLDCAVSYEETELLTRKKQLIYAKVEKKEEEQLSRRIEDKREKIERLVIENGKLQARMRRLRFAVGLAFTFAMIFLAITVHYARQINEEPHVCLSQVDLTRQCWPDPKATWQRLLDYLLIRKTNHPMDKPIIAVLKFVYFFVLSYHMYRYFRH